MAKSTKQFASNFQRLYFHHLSPKPSPPIPISRTFASKIRTPPFSSKPTSQNGILSQILSQNHKFSAPKTLFPSGFKPFSTNKLNINKLGKSPVVQKPLSAAKTVVNRYREAVGLQAEAFWKRNYLILVGAGGVVVCIALWRVMFGVASTFVGLSEGMAKYGFLALAAAIVSFTVSV